MKRYRTEKGYFFSALLVTDVVTQSSLLAMNGDARMLEQINYPSHETGLYELNGVVSRKKQVMPYLTHCLAQMKT